MSTYQTIWMVLLIPVFIVYGIFEIRRGWKIIKYKEDSLNFAVQNRIKLIQLFAGKQKSTEYQKYLNADKNYMATRGYYSFVGGWLTLLAAIFFVYLLIEL